MKCRLCGFKVESMLAKKYYHCQNCDLIFLDEKYFISAKKEKARYKEHENTEENLGYVKMFKDFIEQTIHPYGHEIKTALDFGCGPGPVLAQLLKEMEIETDIYDPYFYPDKIYQDKKYDLITSTEVFEHLKEPALIILELKKHLSSTGYLAIITRFHNTSEDFNNWWYKRDSTHIAFYSIKTLKYLAEEFSLKLIFTDNQRYALFRNS